MTGRNSVFRRVFDRRRFLVGAGMAGGALVLGRQVDTQGATPTPASDEATAGAFDASPEASPVASPVASPTAVFEASIQSLKFIPREIDISVGTTVVWTNKDSVAHTVTQRAKPKDQIFSSPMLAPGESFSFMFDTPGTYPYFCTPHPFMTGTVVVST